MILQLKSAKYIRVLDEFKDIIPKGDLLSFIISREKLGILTHNFERLLFVSKSISI